MHDHANVMRALDALAGLPLRKGLVWLAGRRPSDQSAGQDPLDMIAWVDAADESIREAGLVKRCEIATAWPGSFLEAANGWNAQVSAVLPEEIRVEDPLGVEILTRALADLPVRVTRLQDAGPLERAFESLRREQGDAPERPHLSELRTWDTMRFAVEFAALRPWEIAPSPPFFAVQGLMAEPVWLAVIGKAGYGVGLVACLDGEGPALFRPETPKAVNRAATLQFHVLRGERGVEPFIGRTGPTGAHPAEDADIALFLRLGEVFLRFMRDFDGQPATREFQMDNHDGPITVRWPVLADDIPFSPGPMNRAARRRLERERGG